MKKPAHIPFTLFLIFLLLQSQSAFSELIDEYHFIDLNLNYNAPQFNGTSKRMLSKDFDEVNAAITGEVLGEDIELKINQNSYLLEGFGSFLKDYSSANISELSFQSTNTTVMLELADFTAKEESSDLLLEDVDASCHSPDGEPRDYVEFVLESCTTNANIYMKRFLQNEPSLIGKIISESLPEFIPGISATTTEIENLSLQISHHNYKVSVKIDAGIKVTAKIEGHVEYNENSKTMVLRVDKAKASFFSIKNKLFEALEDIEDDKLKVERPYVYYLLD